MIYRSRLHLYPHKEPQGKSYIVGEKRALKELARALDRAANGHIGIDNVKLYSSDGHEYEVIIAKDIAEEEWQNLQLPYEKNASPDVLESIQLWESIREECKQDY